MSELSIYFARAMDARDANDIKAEDEKYMKLVSSIGGFIINPYKEKIHNPLEDGGRVAHDDLELLKISDVVLADLSIPDYQYVGCIFEIVHAANNDIPVILVEGERDFHNRYFIQAYCDFISKTGEEAVEYIRRAYTKKGIEEQLAEMHAYYDEIAYNYQTNYSGTDIRSKAEYRQERETLRMIIREHAKGKTFQIGIGTGDWTKTICETADSVVGIDQSERMISEARKNLSSFSNMSFLCGDIFKDRFENGAFDCVVVYFFLSILPRSAQHRLFNIVRQLLKPGGLLIVADTRKKRDFSSIGLGRHQLQQRKCGDRVFTLYKENFYGDSLAKLLEKEGFKVIDSNYEAVWFSWAVSGIPG